MGLHKETMRNRRDPLSAGFTKPSASGFTLLEILVAMTLVAMVTVIAVTAFKLTVLAWQRVPDEGESSQIQSALPVLLDNQLAARVKTSILGQAKINPSLYFCGDENSLSFMTAYAPRGSMSQGMSWVSYQFDPGQKTLFIYQQVVTRLEDMDLLQSGLGSKKLGGIVPVSRIQGLSGFSLAYTSELLFSPDDFRQWQNYWSCGADSIGFPVGLMLKMTIGEGTRSQTFTWVYRLGDQTPQTYVGGQGSTGSSTGKQSSSPFGGG